MINQFILFFLIFLFSFILNIKAHTAGMISQRAPKLFVSLQCLTNLVRILVVKISFYLLFLSYSIPFYVAHSERKWNFSYEMITKIFIKPSIIMILSTAFYIMKERLKFKEHFIACSCLYFKVLHWKIITLIFPFSINALTILKCNKFQI